MPRIWPWRPASTSRSEPPPAPAAAPVMRVAEAPADTAASEALSPTDAAELRQGPGSGSIGLGNMLILGPTGGLGAMAPALVESLDAGDRIANRSLGNDVMRSVDGIRSAPEEDYANLAGTLPSLISFGDTAGLIDGTSTGHPFAPRATTPSDVEPGMATLASLQPFVPENRSRQAPAAGRAGSVAAGADDSARALQRALAQLQPFEAERPSQAPPRGANATQPRVMRSFRDAVRHEGAAAPPVPTAPIVARSVPASEPTAPPAEDAIPSATPIPSGHGDLSHTL